MSKPVGERLATVEQLLETLLERTENLPKLTEISIRHDEKLKNLEGDVVPLKAEAEENKKSRWTSEGVRMALAAAAGFLGGGGWK